jgi:Na+/H+ antiporter NhaD/arsenite permease-like protein
MPSYGVLKLILLWLLFGIAFFMSAVLDNMTTTIVMIMMLCKMIANPLPCMPLFGTLLELQ